MLKIAKIFLLSSIVSISLYGCACQPQSKWVDSPKNENTKETIQEKKVEQTYVSEIKVYSVNTKNKEQTLIYSEKYDSISDGVNQQISYGKQIYSYAFAVKTKEFIFLDDNTILDGKILITSDNEKIKISSLTNLTFNGQLKPQYDPKILSITLPIIHSQMIVKEVGSFPYEEKIVLDDYQIMLTIHKK